MDQNRDLKSSTEVNPPYQFPKAASTLQPEEIPKVEGELIGRMADRPRSRLFIIAMWFLLVLPILAIFLMVILQDDLSALSRMLFGLLGSVACIPMLVIAIKATWISVRDQKRDGA